MAVVDGKVRLGFLACRDIKKGDEVLVDYEKQKDPPPFMRRTRASVLALTATILR